MLNSASAFYDLVKYKNKLFEKSVFLCLFFEGEFKSLPCKIKKEVLKIFVLIPQHLHAMTYIVKGMPNHPKLPEPFWYHLPAVHPNAIGDKEKMVLCRHAAERQFVTKCKGDHRLHGQANFLNASWLIFFM